MRKLELSLGDIAVLAGLLGFKSVFAVDDILLSDWKNNLMYQVKDTVGHLEKRRLIHYDLDGTLFIDSKVHSLIKCLCIPDKAVMISSNLFSGKKKTDYIFKKDDIVVRVNKNKKSVYGLDFLADKDLLHLFPKKASDFDEAFASELLLYEEAQIVRNKVRSFERSSAESFLACRVKSEEAVPVMCEMLSGDSGYVSIQIFENKQAVYSNVYNAFVTWAYKQTIALQLDENDVLHFDSVSFKAVIDEVYAQLKSV